MSQVVHRAGQKVLTVQGAVPRDADFKQPLCADIDGFSLHAARAGRTAGRVRGDLCASPPSAAELGLAVLPREVAVPHGGAGAAGQTQARQPPMGPRCRPR